MYSLMRINSFRDLMLKEFPPFLIALSVAQTYFKWGSFALELVGFLAVWFALGLVVDRVLRLMRG